MATTPPQAGLTVNGLCHNLDVTGSPHAGAVTMRPDGEFQVPLSLGEITGREVTENITSEEYLLLLVDAALDGLSRLSIAHHDQPASAA